MNKGGDMRDKKKPSTCLATLFRCKFPVYHLACSTCRATKKNCCGLKKIVGKNRARVYFGPVYTGVWTNFCTDKSLYGSTVRLHGTGGTGRIIERLRPRLHGSGQIFARTKTCTVPPCDYTGLAELDEYLNG